MRIAIPLEDGLLSSHFGHCESTAPPHEHGVLPRLIAEAVTAYLNGTLTTGDGTCSHHYEH